MSILVGEAPHLRGWTHVYSGKVRDMYVPADQESGRGGDVVLMVASDRISAYDHVLPTTIPGKGVVLTQLTLWWFEQLADLVTNHVVSLEVPPEVEGRAMICRRLQMFPLECVVRGYLTGSALAEYRATGEVCGIALPQGMAEGDRIDPPIYTPASKAAVGDHDENITFEQSVEAVGVVAARRLRDRSLAVFARASEIAAERGLVLADTKFEFGRENRPGDAELVLADEVLTPDSSRFWRAEDLAPGVTPPSIDKQFVRDWLTSPAAGWERTSDAPPPPLPNEVVERTRERYVTAFETLTGRTADV
ncbi:phosphoribosylaminoimidazolesuccinocarboxamide synthase [Georgenia sp. Z1344]|uniref:phosphoribosylaminoimidazolesuccinocarboxamide synthase n=1 Tax=Georgenia sp. Z1344 TaxID=3416706 RepID=UPI003CEE5679